MSNAQRKGKRKGSKRYLDAGRRDANKKAHIKRDEARANPMQCGHGSRHRHPDGRCRRCFGKRAWG